MRFHYVRLGEELVAVFLAAFEPITLKRLLDLNFGELNSSDVQELPERKMNFLRIERAWVIHGDKGGIVCLPESLKPPLQSL